MKHKVLMRGHTKKKPLQCLIRCICIKDQSFTCHQQISNRLWDQGLPRTNQKGSFNSMKFRCHPTISSLSQESKCSQITIFYSPRLTNQQCSITPLQNKTCSKARANKGSDHSRVQKEELIFSRMQLTLPILHLRQASM